MIQSQKSFIGLHTIGEAALQILSNAQQGSVLASVSNAVYLLSNNGEIFWLIPAGYPMHRRGIQVGATLPCYKAGSRYQVEDRTLSIDSGKNLDFHHSPVWMSPTVTSSDIISLSRCTNFLLAVIDQLLIQHIPSGLGSLIVPIVQLTTHQNEAMEVKLKNRVVLKSWPTVKGMILASLADDTNQIISHARSLVGLGEGLTPSGDDFLGGFLFARQVLYRYYPNDMNLSICNYSDFILQSKPLTNLISYTIMKDHLDGRSVEPLHQFANGLLLGESIDQLSLHAEILISIGHSTGWDLLTGFLAGMSVTSVQ